MVGPERRRRAVLQIMASHDFSERRACSVLGQPRSTQRKAPVVVPGIELALRARLREISNAHPRWGYKRATTLLVREGWDVNKKRICRLWRDEGLRVKRRCKKHKRGRTTEPASKHYRATRPNEVWGIDFQFDSTADHPQTMRPYSSKMRSSRAFISVGYSDNSLAVFRIRESR